ncbi:MAG: beta-1,6-N-acetylglucosaminyltransferase [Pseudomonadota bacterium]
MINSTSALSEKIRSRFAYLVLAYEKNTQLIRLLKVIRSASPDAIILLHFDAKYEAPDPSHLDALGVELVEPRTSVMWGDISHVTAVLNSLEYALQRFTFEWMSVISGQDYPVRPLATIERELSCSRFDAYVRADPVSEYRSRYYLRYLSLPNLRIAHRIPLRIRRFFKQAKIQINKRQSLFRFEGGLRGTPFKLGVPRLRTPFSEKFVCYKGSDWFTLSFQAAGYLAEYSRENASVLEYYRHTIIPSESYFQTVLYNAGQLKVCNDNRRFILWDTANLAHPVVLASQHVEEIVQSNKDFARKFDAKVDAGPINRLDEIVVQAAF